MPAPLNFMSMIYPFLVCVPKSAAPARNWTQDLPLSGRMLYQLSYRGQLLIQCPRWPSVLLVSDGPSPTRRAATLSNTQHAICFLHYFEPHSDLQLAIALSACSWIVLIISRQSASTHTHATNTPFPACLICDTQWNDGLPFVLSTRIFHSSREDNQVIFVFFGCSNDQ